MVCNREALDWANVSELVDFVASRTYRGSETRAALARVIRAAGVDGQAELLAGLGEYPCDAEEAAA
jgi:hypothetical protein